MKQIKSKPFHNLRDYLLFFNSLIWLTVAIGFTIRTQHDDRLIASHHRLLAEFNSYRSYDDYQKRISFLETKMTEEVMLIICPIMPEGFASNFPTPRVSQLDTETICHDGQNKKRLITSFQLALNDGAPFKQKSESTYIKINGEWIMTSYHLLF